MNRTLSLSCAALTIAVLGGCASSGYRNSPPAASYPATYPATYPSTHPGSQPAQRSHPASPPAYAYQYGTVDSIQYRQADNGGGGGIGMGTVIGGVVGGLLGNQVGGGSGKKVATVAGVVGGAIVGNKIEQRNGQLREEVIVGVRLDNGGYRTLIQDSASGLQVGSRVRVENDRVYRNN